MSHAVRTCECLAEDSHAPTDQRPSASQRILCVHLWPYRSCEHLYCAPPLWACTVLAFIIHNSVPQRTTATESRRRPVPLVAIGGAGGGGREHPLPGNPKARKGAANPAKPTAIGGTECKLSPRDSLEGTGGCRGGRGGGGCGSGCHSDPWERGCVGGGGGGSGGYAPKSGWGGTTRHFEGGEGEGGGGSSIFRTHLLPLNCMPSPPRSPRFHKRRTAVGAQHAFPTPPQVPRRSQTPQPRSQAGARRGLHSKTGATAGDIMTPSGPYYKAGPSKGRAPRSADRPRHSSTATAESAAPRDTPEGSSPSAVTSPSITPEMAAAAAAEALPAAEHGHYAALASSAERATPGTDAERTSEAASHDYTPPSSHNSSIKGGVLRPIPARCPTSSPSRSRKYLREALPRGGAGGLLFGW